MSTDLLYPCRLKIERACKTLDELDALLSLPRGQRRYNFQHRGFTLQGTPYFRLVFAPIDEMAPVLVGEAISHLRSSLDIAVVTLARLSDPDMDEDKNVQFPFAKRESDWMKTGGGAPRRRIIKLSDEAKAVVDSLRPYRGGDNDLYGLHELSNTDKHRRLISVGSLNQASGFISVSDLQGLEASCNAMEIVANMTAAASRSGKQGGSGAFEDGLTFALSSGISGPVPGLLDLMHSHINLAVEACFAEPDVFDRKPLIPTLRHLCALTGDIIDRLEATA